MQRSTLISYMKSTEDNVKPLKVASGIQGVSFFAKLPRSIQERVIRRSAKTDPTMSFIVEPYSTFLAFEILDTQAAAAVLPPGYKLLPSSLFAEGAERPCAIIGAVNLHTSLFWGSRLEYYLIAENLQTKMLSWIIASYETNTSSYDPIRGFIGPTTKHCVITTSFLGEIIVDVQSATTPDRISFNVDMSDAELTSMKERLWIEGNLSVDYGGDRQANTDPFGLVFDPDEMSRGFKVNTEQVEITHNTFGVDYLDTKPFEVAYFPYAQHFVTTRFPTATALKTADDLKRGVLEMGDNATMW